MRKALYLLTLSLFFFAAQAQAPFSGTVTGLLTAANDRKPIEFANVTLHRAADSVLVKGGLTDERGRFLLENLPEGRFFVRATQVGFAPYRSPAFGLNAGAALIDLAEIQLTEAAKTLAEVSVRATKPFIEKQLDKIVVNVENSIVASGASALEVLQRAPLVTVDQDDRLSLKGRQGVIVMIDGKITPLSGSDLGNYLKGLPAGSVEKIELITNPSAKYDAAGNAGIINIRLKKDQRLGLNGGANLSYGQGFYEKIAAGLNLNYRDRKYNYFGSYNFNHRVGFNNLIVYRRYRVDGNLTGVFDQNNFMLFPFNTHNLRGGVDYFLTKKTTVGVLLNGVLNAVDPRSDNRSDILDAQERYAGRFTTTSRNRNRWRNGSANLNLKHVFDSTGREFTADLDYARYQNSVDQNFLTRYYDAQDNLSRSNNLIGDLGGYLTIASAKGDYTHPIGKRGKVEAGFKASFVTADNDVQFFNRVDNVDVPDPAQSNHFRYRENINALYANYHREWEGLSLQLGLRGEQTVADGNQLTTGQTFRRNYVQVFPSVFVKKTLAKNHDLSASVSRRIDRPSYQQLNPFRLFLDPTTYREGNPYLLPQLTYSAEVSHTYKQKLTSTLSYSRTTNNITSVLLQNNETRVTFQTDRNLAVFNYYALSLSAPLQLTKWWNSNTTLLGFYGQYVGELAGAQLRNGRPTFNFNTTHSFTLPKSYTAEVTAFYQAREAYGISLIEPIFNLSVGVQKAILKKNGTLRLNVTDVAYTANYRGTTQFANIDETFRTRRETRIATLALTYRFGKGTVTPARRRNTGSESEQRRVQMG